MQDLLNIRETTGMAQENMAAFLGLTRQALAKAEKGICRLSTARLLKLTRLQLCLENLPAGDVENKLPVQVAQPGQEIERERECRYLIAVLQRKLAMRETAFKKCMCFYQALCILQPSDKGDVLWIQKMKKDIINKLDNCGPAACMQLRKRVYLLTAEADYISRFVNRNQVHL